MIYGTRIQSTNPAIQHDFSRKRFCAAIARLLRSTLVSLSTWCIYGAYSIRSNTPQKCKTLKDNILRHGVSELSDNIIII